MAGRRRRELHQRGALPERRHPGPPPRSTGSSTSAGRVGPHAARCERCQRPYAVAATSTTASATRPAHDGQQGSPGGGHSRQHPPACDVASAGERPSASTHSGRTRPERRSGRAAARVAGAVRAARPVRLADEPRPRPGPPRPPRAATICGRAEVEQTGRRAGDEACAGPGQDGYGPTAPGNDRRPRPQPPSAATAAMPDEQHDLEPVRATADGDPQRTTATRATTSAAVPVRLASELVRRGPDAGSDGRSRPSTARARAPAPAGRRPRDVGADVYLEDQEARARPARQRHDRAADRAPGTRSSWCQPLERAEPGPGTPPRRGPPGRCTPPTTTTAPTSRAPAAVAHPQGRSGRRADGAPGGDLVHVRHAQPPREREAGPRRRCPRRAGRTPGRGDPRARPSTSRLDRSRTATKPASLAARAAASTSATVPDVALLLGRRRLRRGLRPSSG